MKATLAEDAEIHPIRGQLEGHVYRGPDGMAEAIEAADGDWENLRLEADEILELPDGVVVMARFHARGRASGIEINVPTGWHCRSADGLITYSRAYSKPEEAVAAAGGR